MSLVGACVIVLLTLVPFYLWANGLIVTGTVKCAVTLFFIIFFIVPVVFKNVYPVQRMMIFLNFVNWPNTSALRKPIIHGLPGTRNFYVTTTEGIKLGVWHILPASLVNDSKNSDHEYFENVLNHGEPVILYMHGNSGSRASSHRVELYKILRDLDYHVISFDYRSYADSSPILPSESGVVADGQYMYQWLKSRINNIPLFVWGHSLGTGVSSHVLAVLAKDDIKPNGLILESPFNNLRDEIREHPFAQVFRHFPLFDYFFVDPVGANKLLFESDKHLIDVKCPILILHAEDDVVVPFVLGERLFETVLEKRPKESGAIEFIKFESKYNYGHKYICRSPELPDIIKKFVISSTKM